VKLSRKTSEGVKYGPWAFAVFVGLLGSLMLGPSRAYAQFEIDPDHFDSLNTEPIPQPRPADSRVAEFRRDGASSLPQRIADPASTGQLRRLREVILRHLPLRPFPISLRLPSAKLTKLILFVRDGG
jgi:hypothetical protein